MSVIERTHHKLVVVFKAYLEHFYGEPLSERSERSEAFDLIPPHRRFATYICFRYDDDDRFSISVKPFQEDDDFYSSSSSSSEEECDIPDNFDYTLEFLSDGYVIFAVPMAHYEGEIREVVDGVDCVTIRLTVTKKQLAQPTPKPKTTTVDVDMMVDALMFGELDDFFTIAVESQTIRMAKAIARKKSPILLKMLETQMKEKKTNVLEITDASYSTMRWFAKFLYSGQIKFKNVQKAVDLLYVADKYEVRKLLGLCCDYLANNLDVDNAIDILIVADRHSLSQLEEKALQYIHSSKSLIVKTKGYAELFKPEYKPINRKVLNYLCQH